MATMVLPGRRASSGDRERLERRALCDKAVCCDNAASRGDTAMGGRQWISRCTTETTSIEHGAHRPGWLAVVLGADG